MSLPRIAVIGAGHLGSIHARLLSERADARLVAVVDPIPAARQTIERQLGIATRASLTQLEGTLDAAIVASPTSTHYEVAGALLDRGIHVFVEKPLTPRSLEGRALCQAARKRNCILQVGHSERFNPAWLAAAPFLTGVRRIRATRQSGFPSRSLDVGVVLDLMIHEIDLVLSLTTAPLVDLSAHAATVVGPHEDIVSARLQFDDGMVAELESSRVSPRRERKWDVLTDQGWAEVDFAQTSASVALAIPEFSDVAHQVAGWPHPRRREFADQLFCQWMPHTRLDVDTVNALVAEHDEFLAAIRGESAVTVDGNAGCRAVELAERILAACGTPAKIGSHKRPPSREAA